MLALPVAASAQTTGSIVGRVVDSETGSPLPGVDIRIDKLTHRTTSGADGRFVLGAVPAGERDLRIEHIGFKPLVITRIQVRPGRATEVRVTLESSPIAVAPIVVRSDRERLVEPEVSTTHEAVVGRELRELPVDNIDQVLELTTGVSGGHFRGGRIGQEIYVLDGIELKNQFEASREGFGLELAPSSLEEVDVITGGFGAEYGSALSGVVSYTTRRGNPEAWESRLSMTTDAWAPTSLYRGFNGLSFSTGGPVAFLGRGATIFGDLLMHGMEDADPRARGLTCLQAGDNLNDLAATINLYQSDERLRSLYCPFETGIVPHQRGDKMIAFGRFDKPLTSKWNLTASALRNRLQRELYTAEFKYNPTYQLGQRFVGSMANINLERLNQQSTGSSSFTMRAAVMRLDRYLGAVDPDTWDGAELAGFRPASFKFLGEDFTRQDIARQIELGSAVPGYITPTTSGNSPFGPGANGLFFTEGTPTIANWSRSDVFSGSINWARYMPSGSSFRTGATGNLYKVETYERALANLAGSMPNFARFFPATVNGFAEVNVQTPDDMHFLLGVRVEGFRSGIDFTEDRVDFTAPTISSEWKLNVMPRVGAAFPIPGSEGRSNVRFNFGRVAQPPDFRYFLDSTIGDSLRTDIRRQGNPNLAFEKGNSYEAGLSHLLNQTISVGVTAFRKTLENLVSGNLQLGDAGQAGQFSARDFGTVQGVEVVLRARWNLVSARAGWAVQKAKGVSSGEENDSVHVGENPALNEYPLAFDRRHSGDISIHVGRAAGAEKPWSVSLTNNVQSGYPVFTISSSGERTVREYLPWTSTTDLRASWDIGALPGCGSCKWRAVFDSRNILGNKNILAVRSNTGTIAPLLADVQRLANQPGTPGQPVPRESPAYVATADLNGDGLISLDELTSARFAAALDRFDPTLFFGEGRQLRLGVEVTF